MCHDPRRFEKMKEEREEIEKMYQEEHPEKPLESEEIVDDGIEKGENEKAQDLTDGEELFNIDIENAYRGIKVSIHCADSGDAVFMAGFVISAFRKLGVEAKSKVMP
jgi:hypothetical protein